MTQASASTAAAPWPGERAATSSKALWAHGFTLACLLAWWGASLVLPPYLIAGPVDVVVRAAQFFTNKFDFMNLMVSLFHVVSAVVLACTIGFALALMAYYVPAARLMIRHRWYPFFNSFSGIGWAIIAMLWFGPSHVTVIFAMTTVMVPFVFINVTEGLLALDAELLEMSRSFTRRSWRSFLHIVFPSLLPFLFAALRICAGVAWKSTLLAELFGTNQGLGFMVNQARLAYDCKTIMAVILLIIAVVYITDRLIFSPIQKRLARHYENA
ncbi:ABC transporter permease [Ramlibacter sp.]|uniref:ABC transporter permease n=1 Tax=Ramlibacter sp. TaxID=1917967 RepID=UPI003D143E36